METNDSSLDTSTVDGEAESGSGPSDADIAKAKSTGWAPKEQYKGDPDKWVDADVWNDRAESIMPILQKSNKKLQGEMGRLAQENARLQQQLQEAAEGIQALKEFHEQNLEHQRAQMRASLMKEIKDAREAADVDSELDAMDRLSKLNAGENKPPKKEEKPAPRGSQPSNQPADPEMEAWVADNAEVMGDLRKVAALNAEMTIMRQEGDRRVGRAFLDAALERVSHLTSTPARSRASRVGDSRNGTGDGSFSSGKKGYNDLPRDAKEACTKQTARMVGPSKAFKTAAEWQKYYADTYFSDEG